MMKTRVLYNRRAGLLMLLVILMAYAFICLTRSCFSAAMASIVEMGAFTKTQTGIISAAFSGFYGALQIVGGIVTDRYKPERFITLGFVGAAIANYVIYFNQDYTVILIAWSLNAIAQFAVWPAIFKLLSTMLPQSMRTNAMFATTFVNPAGIVASFLVAAIVGSRWQMNFLISAIGLTFFAILWEAVVLRIKPKIHEVELEQDAGAVSPSNDHPKGGFLKIAMGSGLLLVILICFFRSSTDASIRNLTSTMLNESYDSLNPTLSNLLGIIVLISSTLGSTLARILYPKVIQNEAVALAIFVGGALPLCCALLLLGNISYAWMIVILAILALLLGATTLFTMTYIAARYGKWGKGATVAGAMNAMACMGGVVANAVPPMIADRLNWRAVIFFWIAMLTATALFILILIPIWTRFWKKND